MCPNKDLFSTCKSIDNGIVLIGNNNICKVISKSTVQIKMHDGMVKVFTNVKHVSDLKRNLISLGTLEALGCNYTTEGGVLKVTRHTFVVMKACWSSSLYILQESTIIGFAILSTSFSDSNIIELWHMHLGHMSKKSLSILSKQGLLCGQSTRKLDFCEHCVFRKQKRLSFSLLAIHRTKGSLNYIHLNVWRPLRFPSTYGVRNMLTFIDDYSRNVWVYFLKHKNNVFLTFKQWKVIIEKQIGNRLNNLEQIMT